MRELSKRHLQALQYIDGYLAKHGFSPSHTEIRKAIGIESKSHVSRILDALAFRGLIRRLPCKARTIELIRGNRHGVDGRTAR